jgi:hypothetical protein
MRTLQLPENKVMVAAECDDGYEAHYSEDYRAAHHPFFGDLDRR